MHPGILFPPALASALTAVAGLVERVKKLCRIKENDRVET